jgi:hypothetical protein
VPVNGQAPVCAQRAIAGGKTRLNVRSSFANTADRDGMLQSGMEVGARESYDRMAELLLTLS